MIRLLIALAVSLVTFTQGLTQEYPTRPIKILIGLPAGGGADVIVRYFADQLKDSQVPQLRGVLVEAKPACRPKELTVAVPLPNLSGRARSVQETSAT